MDDKMQIHRDEIDKEKIIKDLVMLGFTLNDARVYVSLFFLGPSKPVSISEDCEVDRSRVYDSLRRLSKKGYALEEPVKRGSLYKAKNPNEILRELRKDYRIKGEISTSLEKKFEQYQPAYKQPFLVSIHGEIPIFREIISLISNADQYIQFIITPDFSMKRDYFIKIVDSLVEKKHQNPNIKIEIALNHKEGEFQFLLKKLHENDILIYLWYVGNVLPFGLYLSEKSYIFTTLDVEEKPTYNIGLTIENARPGMTEGFRQLFAFNNASYFKQGKMKRYTKSLEQETKNSESKVVDE